MKKLICILTLLMLCSCATYDAQKATYDTAEKSRVADERSFITLKHTLTALLTLIAQNNAEAATRIQTAWAIDIAAVAGPQKLASFTEGIKTTVAESAGSLMSDISSIKGSTLATLLLGGASGTGLLWLVINQVGAYIKRRQDDAEAKAKEAKAQAQKVDDEHWDQKYNDLEKENLTLRGQVISLKKERDDLRARLLYQNSGNTTAVPATVNGNAPTV